MKQPRPRPPIGHTLLDFVSVLPRHRINRTTIHGCPPGDLGPVLVLPGIFHDDRQTASFRGGLQMLDYTPYGWDQGTNYGPARQTMDGVTTRLAHLYRDHGPVRLIGFSMGGLFARWLAQARPHMIRQVITVCTPFRDSLNSAWLPIKPLIGLWRHVDTEALSFMVAQTPPMAWAALYSPMDGVVAWRSCMEPEAMDHCVEVRVRHRHAMAEAAVLRAVAGCLAGPKD
jgi:pimeloyl-ACP methyl ester carboxylesterase